MTKITNKRILNHLSHSSIMNHAALLCSTLHRALSTLIIIHTDSEEEKHLKQTDVKYHMKTCTKDVHISLKHHKLTSEKLRKCD